MSDVMQQVQAAVDVNWQPGVAYRYLNLSRRLCVDYGDVLSFADWSEPTHRGCSEPTYWQRRAIERLSNSDKIAIGEEVFMEYERRRQKLLKEAACTMPSM